MTERSPVAGFADALAAGFAFDGAGEDQLKLPVICLLRAAGAGFGLDVTCRTETRLPERGVRPDIAVHAGGLICGYVELKAPRLGADAPRLKGAHNREQWRRLQGLPNLIYSDGREWALYRGGERVGALFRFDGDPIAAGAQAVSPANEAALGAMLRDFLFWQPLVPHQPRPLARYLAPLTRLLRAEVEAALADPASAAALLATEWRQLFFPDADDGQFADAYAQTVTYALLLARLSGAASLEPAAAVAALGGNNSVLALALDRLGQEDARSELRVGFELLRRALEALDPHDFQSADPEIWLYFYEDFLAEYDPKLRRDYGVYYTPRQVVELQVRLVGELLETRFGKPAGFADDGVTVLDPAVGTGTYPVAVVKHALARSRSLYGAGMVPLQAARLAQTLHGFEILIGPYAVAHLRLTQALEAEGAVLRDRLNIYLADTLASPHRSPPGGLTLTYRTLTQEHEAARRMKSAGEILVCLGNPPYDRQQIEADDAAARRKGGWIRFGDRIEGGASPAQQGEGAILADFTEPAARAGAGIHLKNLYNDYVYFWRWALWRLFEQQRGGGIVSFITASSYLAGPGFIGMREMLRRALDELWIIDLGGDNRGTRRTPNVFNIQTPVAIAIGMRGRRARPGRPATVRYVRIDGPSREAKLKRLDGIAGFAELDWRDCPAEWHAPFLPPGSGDFFDWPALTDLFPWQHSGVEFKRNWPIGETAELLRRRWRRLAGAPAGERAALFRESSDHRIDRRSRGPRGTWRPTIAELDSESETPRLLRYGFRSFDTQYALIDPRLAARPRPALLQAAGPANLFFTSLLSEPLGKGPAVAVSGWLPDTHSFCGRGGKDVIPLYRDREGTEPNLAAGLLARLGRRFGREPAAADFAAYVYAVLAGQSYTRRFWNALETPGPRVPVTCDAALFAEGAALGRRLIWLHSFAARFRGETRGAALPAGATRCTRPVSDDPARYPETFAYIPEEQAVRIDDGRFAPVAPEVWGFEVSGLKVVSSWLGYRMKRRSGRRSSPLDAIRPERWTLEMSVAFLELLWVLEATLALEPALEGLLDRILAGPCFRAADLPTPAAAERRPPGPPPGGLLELANGGRNGDNGNGRAGGASPLAGGHL